MKTHDTLVPPATRLALVDFLAFVSLAACIALSVGLVLAGTVLLLSGSAQVPELYADEPVMVLFSAEKLGGPLTVSAQAGDGSWMARVPVAPASGQNALSVLWARERIDALMDRMRGGVPEDEI